MNTATLRNHYTARAFSGRFLRTNIVSSPKFEYAAFPSGSDAIGRERSWRLFAQNERRTIREKRFQLRRIETENVVVAFCSRRADANEPVRFISENGQWWGTE